MTCVFRSISYLVLIPLGHPCLLDFPCFLDFALYIWPLLCIRPSFARGEEWTSLFVSFCRARLSKLDCLLEFCVTRAHVKGASLGSFPCLVVRCFVVDVLCAGAA